MKEQVYVLGHSEMELARLSRQAKVIDPITRRGFLAAGLRAGMRVLDVGSGVGDVALLAASIVGPTGSVAGTDRVSKALEVARARTSAISNISFREGDPSQMDFEDRFDTVVGRYILMFQRDPVSFLRGVARHAKAGGIVAFHEPDWAGARSFPECKLYDRCCDWIVEVVRKSGARERMGSELPATFIEAGLPAPHLEVGELIGGAETAVDPVQLVAELTISLLPEMERYGVASGAEVGPEDLYERMLAEAVEKRATIVCRSEIVAHIRI